MKGYVKLMELLLHTDLNINEINDGGVGRAPFIEACDAGRTEIVNLMITVSKEHGIDLNASNYYGDTALIYAIVEDRTEIAKLMIENRAKYGINIQQENDNGDNALYFVNEKIKYGYDEEKKASFKELKAILEEAISADNESQPSV